MTGRNLYERWQALRGATSDSECPWHSLGYRDKDAWDALAEHLLQTLRQGKAVD